MVILLAQYQALYIAMHIIQCMVFVELYYCWLVSEYKALVLGQSPPCVVRAMQNDINGSWHGSLTQRMNHLVTG